METVKIVKKRNGMKYEIREIGGRRILAVTTNINYPEPVVRNGNKTFKHFVVWFSSNGVTYMYYIDDAKTVYIE